MKHLWKKNQRGALSKRRKIPVKSHKAIKKTNHINCLMRTSTKGRLLRTLNTYPFNVKGGLWHCGRRTGYYRAELRARDPSSFCDIWNMTSCDFTLVYSCLTQGNAYFCNSRYICLVRSTIANLWPIMVHKNTYVVCISCNFSKLGKLGN